MDETKKLYYDDPFLRAFTARVVSCAETGKGGYAVVLDATAFYPEGGGQGADHGTLKDGRSVVNVLDVHEKDGVVTHLCDAPLPVGAEVTGEIDWARRFDHMQQHSGEHICSGLICERFHCDNVGFHLGAETVTIDFNADVAWEELLELERRANEYIWENHIVETAFYRGAALEAIDYRSKKPLDGDVRIVTFPGADRCACCGTHVLRSGQVGLVKFLSCQKFRGGVRIELLCGGRAYRHLAAVWEQNLRVAQSLSAKPVESAAAVARMEAELGALKLRASKLEGQVFAQAAARLAGEGDVLLFEEELPSDSVRRLCDAVMNTCGGRCAVFAGADGAWRYAVGQADGDVRELTKSLNAALHGRGGGKPFFTQGSASCTKAEIEAFFAKL